MTTGRLNTTGLYRTMAVRTRPPQPRLSCPNGYPWLEPGLFWVGVGHNGQANMGNPFDRQAGLDRSGPIWTDLDYTNGAQERHPKLSVSHWQGVVFSAGLCRRPN